MTLYSPAVFGTSTNSRIFRVTALPRRISATTAPTVPLLLYPTKAGYGGWANLSAMQYAVEPPFGPEVTTTIKVSKTALRDLAVWKAASGVAWP